MATAVDTISTADLIGSSVEMGTIKPAVAGGNETITIVSSANDEQTIGTWKSALIMATLASVSFLNTFNSGLLTVGLPRIAADLGLPTNLILWPASVYALALSCTLLMVGAVADVVGNRPIFLIGVVMFTFWTLGCALAKTGNELIAFRTLQGIAMSFCMPTAVGVVTSTFPSGRQRNIAFATFGGGSPIGFASGLVLGGVFVDTVGWRAGYYISCGVNALICCLAFFTVPKATTLPNKRQRLAREVDWVGVVIASTCLALLSYVFANITYSASTIREPQNIVLLTLSVLLIPGFILWVGRQEKLNRPAIIPNSIWRKLEFSSICITVFLTWAMFNAFGYWCTLFFQSLQGVSAIQTSIRFLPLVIIGLTTNLVCGLVVDKISANILVLVASLLSAVAPLLFAIQSPTWPYWYTAFIAMCLSAISSDVLFNISNLVITASFPSNEQALAGGIFNTVTQLGNSVGLAVTAMIASSVTSGEASHADHAAAELKGYQAAFWTCFAAAAVSCITSSIGLRKSGKVGQKRD